MADVLDRLLQMVVAEVPELQGERRDRVEVNMRAELGGTEAGYIRKDPTRMRIARMSHALQHGLPLGEAIQAAGVRRRQGYNILRRPLVKTGR